MNSKDAVFHTLAEAADAQARLRGDSTALRCGEQTLSFAGLNRNAERVAHGLAVEFGLGPGARVAHLGRDSFTAYELLFACAKSRTVFTGVNWRLAPEEIFYILEHSQAEVLFVDEVLLGPIASQLERLPRLRGVIALGEALDSAPRYRSWRDNLKPAPVGLLAAQDDVVVQLYTSGTTGRPKGVALAHTSFFRLMNHMRAQDDPWMGLAPTDSLLLSLPAFHIGGLWWAVQGLAAGACGVIVEQFAAWKALELIQRHRITQVAMVPAMLQMTLAEPDVAKVDLSHVKGLLYGGSPISPGLLAAARQRFGCDFFQIYGMTETGNMAVCLRPEEHLDECPLSLRRAGRPLPGVRVKVIDRAGNPVQPGAVGEICIHSPARMVGYWRDQKATDDVLAQGWIRTGDAGTLDADGYVTIVDRIKDMIIYAGENVFPAEIEAVLSDHPAVAEVAVIGVPDENWGESIKAFVVVAVHHQLKKSELMGFARTRLANFKVPKSVSFVDKLPRNASGKLLKGELRRPYWADRDRQVN